MFNNVSTTEAVPGRLNLLAADVFVTQEKKVFCRGSGERLVVEG